jgi:hypothetical protein
MAFPEQLYPSPPAPRSLTLNVRSCQPRRASRTRNVQGAGGNSESVRCNLRAQLGVQLNRHSEDFHWHSPRLGHGPTVAGPASGQRPLPPGAGPVGLDFQCHSESGCVSRITIRSRRRRQWSRAQSASGGPAGRQAGPWRAAAGKCCHCHCHCHCQSRTGDAGARACRPGPARGPGAATWAPALGLAGGAGRRPHCQWHARFHFLRWPCQ